MTSASVNNGYKGKGEAAAALLLSAACFLLYSLTCCPTVYTGDSGELIAASATAGIAHPTGFPLYTLAARLGTLLVPAGEPALGVNLLSAFLAALSTAALFLALRRTPGAAAGALPAAVLFALSASNWGHAATARVYSSGILVFAVLLLLIFEWRFRSGDARLLVLASFVFGVGTGTHVLVTLAVPAFLLLLLPIGGGLHWVGGSSPGGSRETAGTPPGGLYRTGAPSIRLQVILAATTAAAAGASIYLYLPIRASLDPLVAWGEPSTLSAVFDFVTQKEFAYKIAARTTGGAAAVIAEAASVLRRDLTLVGLAAVVFGIYRTARKNPALLPPLAAIIAGNIAVMLQYGNREDLFVLFRYLWPAEIALVVFAAAGFEGAAEIAGAAVERLKTWRNEKARAGRKKERAVIATSPQPFFRAAPLIFAAVLAVILLFLNFNANNLHSEYAARDHGANILASVEGPALLLVAGDAVFGPADYYLNRTLGGRENVFILIKEFLDRDWYCRQAGRRYPELFPPGNFTDRPAGKRLSPLVAHNIDSLNIYVAFDDPELARTYAAVPEGPVKRLYEPGAVPPLDELAGRAEAAWLRCDTARIRRSGGSSDRLISQIVEFYGKSLNDHGVLLSRAGRLEEAERVFRLAGGFDSSSLEIRLNLGTTLEKLSRPGDAAACFGSVIGTGIPGAGEYAGEKQFARFRLGIIMAGMGNKTAAERELRILKSIRSPQAARYAAALEAALSGSTGGADENSP